MRAQARLEVGRLPEIDALVVAEPGIYAGAVRDVCAAYGACRSPRLREQCVPLRRESVRHAARVAIARGLADSEPDGRSTSVQGYVRSAHYGGNGSP